MQSVLDGYNGTVMAYGQTGTGKTYTLGKLGDEDTSERGIMVRALQDILSAQTDSIHVSYIQVILLSHIYYSICLITLLNHKYIYIYIHTCSYTWRQYKIYLIQLMIIYL